MIKTNSLSAVIHSVNLKLIFASIFFLSMILLNSSAKCQSYISLSFDDPRTTDTLLLNWQSRNDSILKTLRDNNLKAALYVSGKGIDSPEGIKLLSQWDAEGHSISNHSYAHRNYGSKKMSFEDFKNDFQRNAVLIRDYKNYDKRYRFPFLKEGDTREKIDSCREFLQNENYKMGYVSIDASDWYIDGIMNETLKVNPSADLEGFRQFYIYHIKERSHYYDSLATELTGRKIKHVLLLHYNLLNSLFLKDLIEELKKDNFIMVNTPEAYEDSIYNVYPSIVPAGESIVWAIAKESGRYENVLRYPGEDSPYEEAKLNMFLEKYKDLK